MRVLIFHGYMLRGTGSNIYNLNLARALAKLGHEVHLLCQDRETGEEMEPVAMVLPLAPSASSLPRTPANLRACRRCDQLIGLDVSDCPYCGLRQEAL